jgi:putative transposase
MPIQRYKPEQIVTMLRQIEVSIANGKNHPTTCKEAEIAIQKLYRWRKQYGGLKMD